MPGKVVFVLGAGFTRAFKQNAPLLTDPYPLEPLLEKFDQSRFPAAHKILRMEQERAVSLGRFDLERLMTRLDSNMPQDYEDKVRQELDLLRHDLYSDFVTRLEAVCTDRNIPQTLRSFAAWCIEHDATCISLNYDDFLDQALYDVYRQWPENNDRHWHPHSGYGFFCPHARFLIKASAFSMGKSSLLLLKLHGSMNWRIKRGATFPYQLDTVRNDSEWALRWSDAVEPTEYDRTLVERHLEPTKFVILPVLSKSEITKQPTFRLVWAEAYKALAAATQVIFIGYSMPRTDIAASFLFSEALDNSKQIDVVNYSDSGTDSFLIASYKAVLPYLRENQFSFEGSVKWLERNSLIQTASS